MSKSTGYTLEQLLIDNHDRSVELARLQNLLCDDNLRRIADRICRWFELADGDDIERILREELQPK